jgi:hypothetical protein
MLLATSSRNADQMRGVLAHIQHGGSHGTGLPVLGQGR